MRQSLVGLALASALAASFPSAANATEAAASSRALELGRSALAHYQAHEFARAFAEFEAAEHEQHSPVFLLYMARCQREEGAWRLAVERFQQIADEALEPDAPRPWREAGHSAERERAELQALLPSLSVHLLDPSSTVEIRLDDVALEQRDFEEYPLDPGTHQISVARAGSVLEARSFEALPGSERIVIELGPYSVSDAGAAAASNRSSFSLSSLLARGAGRALPARMPVKHGWTARERGVAVAWSAAAFAASVGAVSALLAVQERSFLGAHCEDSSCDPALEAHAARGRRYANVATAALAVSGVALVTGGVLFYAAPALSGDKSSAVLLGANGRF